ncbi:BrnA antitoxin family protein [Marinihelvus fidelis]|uniref:BrnA antitoxin family protein n=1 Tax=Marinihelvus fidelis TaxID=2613842 RepID=A0A5N0T6D4_9GAMM|nr:BrnA antitoxin family protein [Marinihelvus fidelis]KAA9130523.1 BrnA antitoxin family protein [Marinihelvus fidelis]
MSKKNTSDSSVFSDMDRLRRMRDEDIDLSDIPEVTPEMFANCVVRVGLKPVENKKQVTLRVDADVLKWFRAQGRGYQTKINALLRAYMEAHKPG